MKNINNNSAKQKPIRRNSNTSVHSADVSIITQNTGQSENQVASTVFIPMIQQLEDTVLHQTKEKEKIVKIATIESYRANYATSVAISETQRANYATSVAISETQRANYAELQLQYVLLQQQQQIINNQTPVNHVAPNPPQAQPQVQVQAQVAVDAQPPQTVDKPFVTALKQAPIIAKSDTVTLKPAPIIEKTVISKKSKKNKSKKSLQTNATKIKTDTTPEIPIKEAKQKTASVNSNKFASFNLLSNNSDSDNDDNIATKKQPVLKGKTDPNTRTTTEKSKKHNKKSKQTKSHSDADFDAMIHEFNQKNEAFPSDAVSNSELEHIGNHEMLQTKKDAGVPKIFPIEFRKQDTTISYNVNINNIDIQLSTQICYPVDTILENAIRERIRSKVQENNVDVTLESFKKESEQIVYHVLRLQETLRKQENIKLDGSGFFNADCFIEIPNIEKKYTPSLSFETIFDQALVNKFKKETQKIYLEERKNKNKNLTSSDNNLITKAVNIFMIKCILEKNIYLQKFIDTFPKGETIENTFVQTDFEKKIISDFSVA